MVEITEILNAIESGDRLASDKLLPLVYEELRRLAASKLSKESASNSLQPTILVHEAYLRLVKSGGDAKWNSKGHFFAAAAEAMRRILVELARQRQSKKRGGEWNRLPLENVDPESDSLPFDLLDLNDALVQFESEWPDQAKLVKLRYFAGLTIAETAQSLGISHATTERHWAFAKAWLYRRLSLADGSD